jgi:hypothetical protein
MSSIFESSPFLTFILSFFRADVQVNKKTRVLKESKRLNQTTDGERSEANEKSRHHLYQFKPVMAVRYRCTAVTNEKGPKRLYVSR